MLQTERQPALRSRASHQKSLRYINKRRCQITKIPKKNKGALSLESTIKEWCVDLLAEARFDGAGSLEHQWAQKFWARSGGRLRNV